MTHGHNSFEEKYWGVEVIKPNDIFDQETITRYIQGLEKIVNASKKDQELNQVLKGNFLYQGPDHIGNNLQGFIMMWVQSPETTYSIELDKPY
jgi:hypothetical protein